MTFRCKKCGVSPPQSSSNPPSPTRKTSRPFGWLVFLRLGLCEGGFERRLLAAVRWTVATAVALPQQSESTFPPPIPNVKTFRIFLVLREKCGFPRQKVDRFVCENALTLDVTLKRLIRNGSGDHYRRFDTLSSELVGFATFPHGADEGVHPIGAFPLHSHRSVRASAERKRHRGASEILRQGCTALVLTSYHSCIVPSTCEGFLSL